MKRWTLRIFVLLLLGAIINAALAWGALAFDQSFVLRRSRGPSPMPNVRIADQIHDSDRAIWQTRPADLVSELSAAMNASRWAYDTMTLSGSVRPDDRPLIVEGCHIIRAGWPLRSFEGLAWMRSQLGGGPKARWSDGLWMVAQRHDPLREIVVPVHVAPAGFLVNALLFATILWLPFGALSLRRRRRIQRGLCPKCAYDLRGSDGSACPECGLSMARAVAQTGVVRLVPKD